LKEGAFGCAEAAMLSIFLCAFGCVETAMLSTGACARLLEQSLSTDEHWCVWLC